MTRTIIVLIFGAMAMLSGCAQINVKSPPPESTSVSPQNDSRSASELRAENRELRAKLAPAETDRRNWQLAVDKRQGELEQLKRQRETVKNQRDQYKKVVEKDD